MHREEYGLTKEIGIWIRDHRVVVISAANALAILILTCAVAGLIQVSARRQAYADARAPRMEQETVVPVQPPSSAPIAVEKETAPRPPRLRVRTRRPAHPRPSYSGDGVEVRPRGYVPRQEPPAGSARGAYSAENEAFAPETFEVEGSFE